MLSKLRALLNSSHYQLPAARTIGRYAALVTVAAGMGLWMYQHSLSVSEKGNEASLLKLPYHEFDQSWRKGWRLLSDSDKYQEAAELIVKYIKQYKNQNTSDIKNEKINELFTLYLHAAQCYGFAGNYEKALYYFELSKYGREILGFDPVSESNFILIAMNAYIDGNMAFLKNDAVALSRAIEVLSQHQDHKMTLESGEEIFPFKANLNILLNLQRGLKAGLGYKDAYEFQEEKEKPTFS